MLSQKKLKANKYPAEESSLPLFLHFIEKLEEKIPRIQNENIRQNYIKFLEILKDPGSSIISGSSVYQIIKDPSFPSSDIDIFTSSEEFIRLLQVLISSESQEIIKDVLKEIFSEFLFENKTSKDELSRIWPTTSFFETTLNENYAKIHAPFLLKTFRFIIEDVFNINIIFLQPKYDFESNADKGDISISIYEYDKDRNRTIVECVRAIYQKKLHSYYPFFKVYLEYARLKSLNSVFDFGLDFHKLNHLVFIMSAFDFCELKRGYDFKFKMVRPIIDIFEEEVQKIKAQIDEIFNVLSHTEDYESFKTQIKKFYERFDHLFREIELRKKETEKYFQNLDTLTICPLKIYDFNNFSFMTINKLVEDFTISTASSLPFKILNEKYKINADGIYDTLNKKFRANLIRLARKQAITQMIESINGLMERIHKYSERGFQIKDPHNNLLNYDFFMHLINLHHSIDQNSKKIKRASLFASPHPATKYQLSFLENQSKKTDKELKQELFDILINMQNTYFKGTI